VDNHFSEIGFEPYTGKTLFDGAVRWLVDLLRIRAVAGSKPGPKIGDLA